ncbi:MAG: DUF4411 family protein [Ignavibacteriales bacterium]|nr:DUF4411 family protein [Ignavibacteriales bacterium]
MKVVIDTNSLLSLVRYYIPFDIKSILFDFFKKKIEQGEIIIIDKVLEECIYNSKGIVIDTLPYLQDKAFQKSAKVPYKTETLLAPNTKQFLHQLNTVFVNSVIKKQRGFSEVEFESQKDNFLDGADAKQIILCLNLIKNGEKVILATEETESSNDNKLFKKIPTICKELGIVTKTLPALLKLYKEIDMNFK